MNVRNFNDFGWCVQTIFSARTRFTPYDHSSKNRSSQDIRVFPDNHHWIRILTALPTQTPRYLLNRKSLNWSWIISRINRVWLYKGLKIWETAMDWHIDWVGKAVRILIQWWLLLWVQIPLEATFFLLFKTLDVNFVQKCQICVEKENFDCVHTPPNNNWS